MPASVAGVRAGTARGRWVIAATVLGSGIAFLDATVVNVALPTIGRELDAGLAWLQWILDGYLVTLTGLMLLGGALGDRYGHRRMFVVGLAGFSLASLLCAAAPTAATLVAARALQGVGAAFLVPASLAIISASFHPDDRGRAVGTWAGLSGVTAAVGPFVGGWLVEAWSWRLIFLINLPIAAAAAWVALEHVPVMRAARPRGRLDLVGAAAISLALAAIAFAAIEGPVMGGWLPAAGGVLGAMLLFAFIGWEAGVRDPMLPLSLFRSPQFTGANLTTLTVYAGLGATTFLVVLQLQVALGYSPLASGAALLPVTILMLVLSGRFGAIAQRIGPRIPMTVGPLVVALGMLMFVRVEPGASFVGAVVAAGSVLGLGLAITVAPLTATVLAAAGDEHQGVASAINNAVARLAALLAVAVLPGLVGLDLGADPAGFTAAFRRAMVVSAALCVAGGALSFATVRTSRRAEPTLVTLVEPCVAGRVTRR